MRHVGAHGTGLLQRAGQALLEAGRHTERHYQGRRRRRGNFWRVHVPRPCLAIVHHTHLLELSDQSYANATAADVWNNVNVLTPRQPQVSSRAPAQPDRAAAPEQYTPTTICPAAQI